MISLSGRGLLYKALRVVDSCRNAKQFNVAIMYCLRVTTRLEKRSYQYDLQAAVNKKRWDLRVL